MVLSVSVIVDIVISPRHLPAGVPIEEPVLSIADYPIH